MLVQRRGHADTTLTVHYLSSQELVRSDAQWPPVHREGVAGVGALECLEKLRS